jgi:hypothetical protein
MYQPICIRKSCNTTPLPYKQRSLADRRYSTDAMSPAGTPRAAGTTADRLAVDSLVRLLASTLICALFHTNFR